MTDRRIADPLAALTRLILRTLSINLPKLSNDWWADHVVSRLTFQQQQRLSSERIQHLEDLDLAALLRILDQNWHELSTACVWSKSARNWLKEALTIRNRWAHAPASGVTDDDVYRDLDTIERLIALMDNNDASLASIKASKAALMNSRATNTTTPQAPPGSNGQYANGALVRLLAKQTVIGAIVARLPGTPEDRYQVFHDGALNTYYESQIEALPATTQSPPVGLDTLNAALTALQLRHPSTSLLYSLHASRIEFVPYQFRPILKLIQSDRPRLLIADEVGVGKTIEAGLVIKELQARREIRSVLIICPKPLVAERKWLEEMKRFDEQFVHIDGASMRYCIEEMQLDGVWPQQYSHAIVPYSLFDESLLMGKQVKNTKQRGLLDLDNPPTFDLVIVDEAHHIRNTDTWAYRTVRYFCDNAEAVVLLTATPIQLGQQDLFTLLNLLRPDLIYDTRSYEQMAAPNPHINAAIESARHAKAGWQDKVRTSLAQVARTEWGRNVMQVDESLQQAFDLLDCDPDDAETRVAAIHKLEDLYTFAPYINRTRRRDIGSFTLRKPVTVEVAFTEEQADLHNQLIALIASMLGRRHGDLNLKFMLTTLRRQTASCVFGLAPLIESMLQRHVSNLELSEIGDNDASDSWNDIVDEFKGEIDQLARKARAVRGPDPKLEALRKTIRDKQKLANNKLLIFSTFRHTLAYLIDSLSQDSIRVALIHGDVPDDERRAIRHRFSLSKQDPTAIDVLLSSEVGCEGLDFQFCDGMVNYDLPWNPMRVEQRIGRIDRYGQKSDSVAIYNFITPGTVDAEIYHRCLVRIGVFRTALGGSEEILGKLTRDIQDIAENLFLTPEEQSKRLQQLADNEIRVVQEQERLEESEAALFGLQVPKTDQDMIQDASSYWLTQSMMANLIGKYLTQVVNNVKDYRLDSNKPVSTISLDQKVRDQLLAEFKGGHSKGAVAKTWERWLKGSSNQFTFTLDPKTAQDRRDVAFINPTHPLTRQAALAIDSEGPAICNISVTMPEIKSGRYAYAIYRWQKIGLKDDFMFQPVSSDLGIASHLMKIMANARDDHSLPTPSESDKNTLEATHHALWSDMRARHVESIQQIATVRLASLKTTHKARIDLLTEQRDSNPDTRIRRMRDSQIDSAEADYQRRIADLTKAPNSADIIAELVVYGTINVEAAG